MLDSYIRNYLEFLNERVKALEENKNKPNVPSGEEEEDEVEEDENRKFVVLYDDLDRALLKANFRSVNISKEISEDYKPGTNDENKYVDNKDDPAISLEVIHGRARMGTLNITKELIKEVKTNTEEGGEEEEYYEYLSTNEAYTKEEIDGIYGTKITNNTNSIKKICGFDELLDALLMNSCMLFNKSRVGTNSYVYFKSPYAENYFTFRDTSTAQEPSRMEFVLLEDSMVKPQSITSIIKINKDQVEIPKLIQATDNPYLTKNDINEFSYNSDDNKLHCTATIQFETNNFQDNEYTYMQFHSTQEGSTIKYALKEYFVGSDPALKIINNSYNGRDITLLQIEYNKIIIPELRFNEETRYATEPYVTEQINTFQSKFYIMEAVIPANQTQAVYTNSIPNYLVYKNTHQLIMPNTDGKHIFTVRKLADNKYMGNWVTVRITDTNITFLPLETSTEEIKLYVQFEWVAKATG